MFELTSLNWFFMGALLQLRMIVAGWDEGFAVMTISSVMAFILMLLVMGATEGWLWVLK